MSNPGVLYLATKNISNGVAFRIEDNIGEAIHLHYGDELRIDLSVQEFFSLSSILRNSLNDLLGHTGFDEKNFDPIFLDMFSSDLIRLERVSFERIKLSELRVQTKNRIGLPVIRGIAYSRVFKALNGDSKELLTYEQENYREQSNTDRAYEMKNYLEKVEYPFNNQYIVLFNDQNIIRDGQHRASCLYYLYGDIEIPVIRMKFKDSFNNVSMHPWVLTLFSWDWHRIKNTIRRVYICIRSFFSRVKRKLLRIVGVK